MKRTEITRSKLYHLAIALALGVGLGAASAQAQTIVDVGGAGTIGDTTLTTAKVPAGANWTATGNLGGTKFSGLVSPAVTVTATGPVTLTFDHRYDFESGWDGGALFVSVNSGAFTYVPTASFSSNPYVGNTTVNTGSAWETGGEDVFYGQSAGYATPALIQSVANLGTLNAGDSVAVEFRGGWDALNLNGPPAWEIGTVQISDTAGPLLDVDFTADGSSGFTVANIGTVTGPWTYSTTISRFEIDAATDTADRYLPVTTGSVIDLNGASIQVVLLAGTLAANDTFTLFDLSGGTTLTGAVGNLTLPQGTWDTSNLAVNGTITLLAPALPASQLGVLDLAANGGINPNTNAPWQVGDRYRLAFYTNGTTKTESNDPAFFNDFVTSQAWAVPALQGTYWAAMVTINLDGSVLEANSPKWTVKQNTGTGDLTGGAGVGGAGEPVYVVNGTTCIARNNADIWNAWSNPFAANTTLRVGNVNYSPYLDQFGNQIANPDANHGVNCATGCDVNGNTVRPLGNTLGGEKDLNYGSSNANTAGRVWNRFGSSTDQQLRLYAISIPLTIVDMAETVAPTLVSIVDDRSGADAILGLDTVTYTVTFSEPIDASTVDASDFGFGGTATATIDRVFGTLDPRALEITVTPTTAGTLILQVAAGAVLTDPVGNALNTTTALPDDTTVTVVEDVTAPTLVSIVDDREGASLVVGTGSIVYTVTFDEAMVAGTVEASDFENAGTATLSVDLVAATEDPAVFEVTATPTTAGTLQLQIAAGAVLTDLIGNPLNTSAGLPDDTTITIDPDITAPVVDTLSPANGATGTSNGPILVATFSENIAKGTGDIEVRRTSDDSLVDTIDVTSGAVTVSGGKATISLGVVLDTLVEYYVLVDSGAFTDLFGNAFGGITLKTEWGFTTGEFGLIGVTAAGQFFPALFEEYGGQSWLLIGRGREGWEFDTDGQGTPGEVGQNLKDPAGFAPKALSDAIVNDLLSQAGKTFPNDVVIRLMRASTTDGTGEYQELRYTNFTGFPNGNTEFTFVFDDASKFADMERVNAPAGLAGATIGTGNDTIRDHDAGGNSANRVFTWDWDGHNFQQGFSTGQTVQGVDGNNPNTFLWEFATEGHAIPYTEVWLQLEVPSTGDETFATWLAGYPGVGAMTGFTDDPDGDGNGNGLENFFGTDPSVFTAGVIAGTKTGNTFTFTHPQNATPASDVTAAYTWSTDLATFTADGVANGGTTVSFAPVPNTPTAGTTTVTATVTGTALDKLFVRVAANQAAAQ